MAIEWVYNIYIKKRGGPLCFFFLRERKRDEKQGQAEKSEMSWFSRTTHKHSPTSTLCCIIVYTLYCYITFVYMYICVCTRKGLRVYWCEYRLTLRASWVGEGAGLFGTRLALNRCSVVSSRSRRSQVTARTSCKEQLASPLSCFCLPHTLAARFFIMPKLKSSYTYFRITGFIVLHCVLSLSLSLSDATQLRISGGTAIVNATRQDVQLLHRTMHAHQTPDNAFIP